MTSVAGSVEETPSQAAKAFPRPSKQKRAAKVANLLLIFGILNNLPSTFSERLAFVTQNIP